MSLSIPRNSDESLGVRNVVATLGRYVELIGLGQIYGFAPAYLRIGRNNNINIMPIMLVVAQTKKAT